MSIALSSKDLSFLKNTFLDVLNENASQTHGEIYRSAVLLGIEMDTEKHFIFPDGRRYKLQLVPLSEEVEDKEVEDEVEDTKPDENQVPEQVDFNTCFSKALKQVHPNIKLANDACLWLEKFSTQIIPFLVSNIDLEHNITIMKNKIRDAIEGELGKHAGIELEKSTKQGFFSGSLSVHPSLISKVLKMGGVCETTLDKHVAVVLDYLLAEILELAGNEEWISKIITVSTIQKVTDKDAEIKNLLKKIKM